MENNSKLYLVGENTATILNLIGTVIKFHEELTAGIIEYYGGNADIALPIVEAFANDVLSIKDGLFSLYCGDLEESLLEQKGNVITI